MKKRKFAEGGPPGTTSYASSGSAGGTNIDFKDAFRAARKQGLDTFSWRGKKYTTELASEKKEEAPKSKGPSTRGGARNEPESKPKGPSTRGGPRMETVTISAKREKPSLPSDRATAFRSQAEETGMSSEERAKKAREYAGNIAGAAGAGAVGRGIARRVIGATARRSLGERGLEMSKREETGKQMEKFRQQMEARQRLSRGSVYKSGGSVKKGVTRGDGLSRVKTKGRMV